MHVLGEPLADFRDAIARRMTSKVIGERTAVWQQQLEITRIVNRVIAEPLIAFLAKKRSGGSTKSNHMVVVAFSCR